MKEYKAPPMASAMIESMRDLGYSFETALADIIDNSITAKATEIEILCDADGPDPVLAICDDGLGMSKAELLAAMRPGSKNPLDNREDGDLGRFGLGLKTASFSQCRRMTVVSRKQNTLTAARWDLDLVAKRDEWVLQLPEPKEIASLPLIDSLKTKGTIVIWERLDRLIEETQKTTLKDHLYERLDSARKHLELVFHRFLAGEKTVRKVKISINGRLLEPFDPFHSLHRATQRLPSETIPVGGANVLVQAFVLPHHQKVTKSDWERYAGDGGYLKNQGFYVYRSARLIIHGTWFRIIKQSELTKLARVRVDMPPELDHLWKVDVKKASASPPLVVRQRLKTIIDRIAGASNRVYTARGARIRDANIVPLWCRRVNKNEISYEVNREHPTVLGFIENLDEATANRFCNVLEIVERTFPIDAIYSDYSSKPEELNAASVEDSSLLQVIDLTIGYLKESQLTDAQIIDRLRKTDPFRSKWGVAEPVIKKYFEKG